jgi:hypothetical protein
MAVGGWIYDYYRWEGHSKDQTANEAWWNAIKGKLEGMTDWSSTTGLTSYVGSGSLQAYYAVSEHTGGARLVWVFVTATSGTIIHSTNMADGGTEAGTSSRDPYIYVAYMPSGAGALTGNPASSGFLPADSLKFVPLTSSDFDTIYSTGQHFLHFMVRGDDIILGIEYNSHQERTIDQVHLLGTVYDTLGTAGDTDQEGMISWTGTAEPSLTGSGAELQCFAADASLRWGRLASEGTLQIAVNTDYLVITTVDRSPWPWVSPIAKVDDPDLVTNGIASGQGVKGALNPEMFRYTQPLNRKQKLDSGNFMHLRGGFVVGWDPSNGSIQ